MPPPAPLTLLIEQVSDKALLSLGSLESRLKRLNTAGAYKVTKDGERFLFTSNPTLLLYVSPNEFGKNVG